MEEENVKKHIHQIIGITDDERVLAECNLIEEILNKEDKLSQYYKQQEKITNVILYLFQHIDKRTYINEDNQECIVFYVDEIKNIINILRGNNE